MLGDFVQRGRIAFERVDGGVSEGEVVRVDGKWNLAFQTDTHTREAQALVRFELLAVVEDGVANGFVRSGSQHVFEQQVLVEWIVLWRGLLVGNRIIQRQVHFGFIRKETAHIEIQGHFILPVILDAAFGNALLQTAETVGDEAAAGVDGAQVGQSQHRTSQSCPTTLFLKA